jgi:hypothetical protein
MVGGWRKLHNEEFHKLHSSPNIFRIIKLRMRWAGQVACMGRRWMLGGWRKLHNEEFHNLHSSPNIFRIIKFRMMRWAGQVACMGRRWMHAGFWWEKPEENRLLWSPRHRWEDITRRLIAYFPLTTYWVFDDTDHIKTFLYCCMCIHCHGNVFI